MGRVPSLNRWYPSVVMPQCCNAYIYMCVCWSVVTQTRIFWNYIDSPSPHKMISHHIKGITVLYSYKHCILGLLIVWTLIDRRSFFHYKKLFSKNVSGVLKLKFFSNFFLKGEILGCLGTPHAPPGVALGRKTIHFFLWPWPVTGENFGTIRLAVQNT